MFEVDNADAHLGLQALLIYDALSTRFTRVRLRPRRPDCAACAPDSQLRSTEGGPAGYDYAAFTGGHAPVEGGAGEDSAGAALGPGRITAAELAALMHRSTDACCGGGATESAGGGGGGGESGAGGASAGVLLVDVRPRELFEATRIPGAMHVAMREVRMQRSSRPRALLTSAGLSHDALAQPLPL